MRPNAVKGDEQSTVPTFLLLPRWEGLRTSSRREAEDAQSLCGGEVQALNC